jgi:hypothetical protein
LLSATKGLILGLGYFSHNHYKGLSKLDRLKIINAHQSAGAMRSMLNHQTLSYAKNKKHAHAVTPMSQGSGLGLKNVKLNAPDPSIKRNTTTERS